MCIRVNFPKIIYNIYFLNFFILTIVTICSTSGKEKRQLFREHLTPQIGGKVPEFAFHDSRIALNRLNQNGIYTTDGIYLEQRPNLHDGRLHHFRETVKITVRPHDIPHTIDTSYVITDPVKYSIVPSLKFRTNALQPSASLRLLQNNNSRRKTHSNNNIDASAKEIILSLQILHELTPYIHKYLH